MTGSLDLGGPRAIHIVGIGGAGMSAIATVLARMGHAVSGSDLKDSPTLERLRLLGVDARVGHDADHLPDALDAVVTSTAIPSSNPEVEAARARGIAVMRRADALRALVATRRGVAVAGSHGKTTASSMLALCLRAAGWRPSFVIGGDLNEVGTNAAFDEGEWLVVEADESDGTFLELEPEAALVTNVEPDHLDHYGGFESLVAAFEQFLAAVPGVRGRLRRRSDRGDDWPPLRPGRGPTGGARTPTTVWWATRVVAAGVASSSCGEPRPSVPSSSPFPAATTR